MDNLKEIITLSVVFILINYLVFYFWNSIIQNKKIAIFFLPGIVIHEILHLVACLLTFTKVTKVKLFSLNGGYVRHKKRNSIISVFISLFPIIGSLAILYFLFKSFDLLIYFEPNFDFLNQIKIVFLENYNNFYFWLLIYLSTTIFVCMIPSKKDFQNSFLGLLFIVFLFLVIFYFNLIKIDFNFFLNLYEKLIRIAIAVGILPFVFGFFAYAFKKIILIFKVK